MAAEPVSPPRTLAEMRQRPHVSYSQIRTYMICPQKFLHSYTLKSEASHRPVALILGGAVHEALGAYYSCLQATGSRISQDEMFAVFRDAVEREMDKPVPISFDEDNYGEGPLVDEGVRLLGMFYDNADSPVVLGVEIPFAAELYDPATGETFDAPLIGAIDLIVQGPKCPTVVEHNTSSKRYAAWQLELETQPSVYKYGAERLGYGNVDMAYQILVKGKSPSLQIARIERHDRHIREMMSTFAAVIRGVDNAIFFRNRSWACSDCQFRYRCDEQ